MYWEGEIMAGNSYKERNRKRAKMHREKGIDIKLTIIGGIIVAAVVLLLFFNLRGKNWSDLFSERIENIIDGGEGKVVTVSEASISKVFEISELATADYTYNAIARAYKEDGITVRYYVAYEGELKAGIDFSKIVVDINEEDKMIFITIPEVEIQEIRIDPGTLEYIFNDKKSETETVHQEAYEICKKDLEERIYGEEDLLKSARENAIAVVKALVVPWVEQLDAEYKVEIR